MQYRNFNGLDKVQNFGGGHPLCLNFAKLRNAELQWLRFSLCGDLLYRAPRLIVDWDSVTVVNIVKRYNVKTRKTFKSIFVEDERYYR